MLRRYNHNTVLESGLAPLISESSGSRFTVTAQLPVGEGAQLSLPLSLPLSLSWFCADELVAPALAPGPTVG